MAGLKEKIKGTVSRITEDLKDDAYVPDPYGGKRYADDNLTSSFGDVDDIFQTFPGDESYDEELDALIYEEFDFSADSPLAEDWQAEDDFEIAGRI